MPRSYLDRMARPLRSSVRLRIYAAFALLLSFVLMLTGVAIYSLHQQSTYRDQFDTSAQGALNAEKANGLIFAVVMESRGVYMSTDPAAVQRFTSALLQRNRELAQLLDGWQRSIPADDQKLFDTVRSRVVDFIRFRNELARLATTVSQGAAREWGDNDANRAVRIALNEDLAALATIYANRARMGDDIGFTKLVLIALGVLAVSVTFMTLFLLKALLVTPILHITAATDSMAAGKPLITIPHLTRTDEIGKLAAAVQQLQKVFRHNETLRKKERAALREQAVFKDNEAHFVAAINNMAQGLVILNPQTNVVLMNDAYKKIYKLPDTITDSPCSLSDILHHRAEAGLFSGDAPSHIKAIQARIALGKPTTSFLHLKDGRWIRIVGRSMPGGDWVATHEDFTRLHQVEQMLERIERLFGTVAENIGEAILARDTSTDRYVFVNRAAEVLFGMPRSAIIGRTARELFETDTADTLDGPTKPAQKSDAGSRETVQTIMTPGNGRRTAGIRHIPASDWEGVTHCVVTLIDDRTGRLMQTQTRELAS
ncbi:PAS-domain containing protein [Bosea sp. (in: a-proteobacteria)]|uniref:PAS-domain containing protein n=1 Tax=Bosea sp. (in: a-proteobacteria) TaxID=1871050 RepID=UPI0027350936|nr:PAS-domain containing protein [Bosea sp. (in: a-proteobacteria)]MDP3408878.1 PAS-domain containing protein [Bosea sp. (in: a-proteobacteria)]